MPIEDVRAIADWSLIVLKDELNKRHVKFIPGTCTPKLLKMVIRALTLEGCRIGRLVPCPSSGAMSVDPPSAERARSSGAMSVDSLAHASKTIGSKQSY